MSDTRIFEEWGELEYLEPTEFYAGPWKHLEIAEADDGEEYDIVVIGGYPSDIKYTNI